VTAAAALGTIAENPLVEVFETETAEISVGRRSVAATVDGELVRLSGPIAVEIVKGGLRVLRPPETAE
jgi:diacylglycerol kinase family enzyme